MAGRLRPIGEQVAHLREVAEPGLQAHVGQLRGDALAIVNASETYAHTLEQLAVAGGANVYEVAMHRRLFLEHAQRFSATLEAMMTRLDEYTKQAELLAANAALFHLAAAPADQMTTYPRLVHEGYERRAPALDGSNPALPRPEPPGVVALDAYYGSSVNSTAITVRLPPL